MTEAFLLISGLVAAGLRVLICLFFIRRLLVRHSGNNGEYGTRYFRSAIRVSEKPGRKCVLFGLAGAGTVTAVRFLLPLPDFYGIGLEAAWIAFCAVWFFKTDARMSLFISIYYEIAVSFWQFLISAGLGIAFRSEAYLESGCLHGQAAVWVMHLLLAAWTVYMVKRPDRSGREGLSLLNMILLAGFLAVVSLSEQKILAIPADTLTMWTILSVVLMMSVLVFYINRQYEAEKEAARLRAEQAELLERDYRVLNNAYAVNAKLFHDFHRHIGILQQMLSHQNYDGAARYLDELQEPIREMADTVWTGDETVDYLINSRMAAAADCNVRMQVRAEFPRRTNIRSADLCAIIGNLLDNALEAARKVPASEERYIILVIRRINQMLVIKVENSFSEVLRKEHGQLKTTKTEQGLHGWGLKSAQTAAEKYDGMIQTAYEGKVFRAVATLSYHAAPGAATSTGKSKSPTRNCGN